MAKKGVKRDGSKKQAVRDYLVKNPGASLKSIQADLKTEGVEVSAGTINKVKYESPKSKAGGSTSGKSKAGRPTGGVNVSQSIRDYMTDNPDATRPEIKQAMADQGLKAAPALVNNVYVGLRTKLGLPIVSAVRGAKSTKRRPARKATSAAPAARVAAPAPARQSTGLTVDSLVDAKQLVDQLGGIDSVRQALDLLEKLQ
jgi:uncharacterized protein YneF (UPF0154 family)